MSTKQNQFVFTNLGEAVRIDIDRQRTFCPKVAGHVKVIHGWVWSRASVTSHDPNTLVEVFHGELSIPLRFHGREWLPWRGRLFVLVTFVSIRRWWWMATTYQYSGWNNGCGMHVQAIRIRLNIASQFLFFVDYLRSRSSIRTSRVASNY